MTMAPARGVAGVEGVLATRPTGSVVPARGVIAPPEADWATARRWRFWVPAGIAVVAFLARLVPVLRGGGLFGTDTYDPSVYYAAAVGVFSGRLPYRDFLLLHPPGILLALQPFAALGAIVGDPIAMAAARVGFMAMGAGSAFLIYRILLPQHRYAALVGASAYAVWYPAIYAERTVRLEGLATFVVLVGIVVVQRAMTKPTWVLFAAAGALFGFGATVKIWGIVPVGVLVAWVAWRQGWRRATVTLAGATAVILLVIAPFALAGPNLWNMVVLDQLGRPRTAQSLGRFIDISGFRFLPRAVAVAPALIVGVATIPALWLAWRTTLGRLFVLLTLSTVVVLFAGPTWFGHYPAFAGAPLCLLYGAAFGELLGLMAAQKYRRVAIGSVMAGLAVIGSFVIMRHDGTALKGQLIASVLADRPGCVTTDNPTTLIFSNTLRRNLASGCPLVVDLAGYIYELDRREGPVRRAASASYQRLAMDYLASGTTTALIRFGPGDLSLHSTKVIRTWPVVGHFGSVILRQPTR
ncbi:MAG: hypothetical protein ACOH1Y_11050 [Propionicimonas sp.]